MTTLWVMVAIIVAGLALMIFVAKIGAKILPAVVVFVSIGAAVGAALDTAFDSFPKLAIGGAMVVLVGLIGVGLEKLSGE